jgi:hypothetical protein
MLVVETIAKIRRAYFSPEKSIKEICRDLHVSRKVVRKVIRSDATEFYYERSKQPLPKIGPWRDRLDALLAENEGKPARERLTLVRLFEELRGLGYGGSYAAVRRYAIGWRKERGALLRTSLYKASDKHCKTSASFADGMTNCRQRPLLFSTKILSVLSGM